MRAADEKLIINKLGPYYCIVDIASALCSCAIVSTVVQL